MPRLERVQHPRHRVVDRADHRLVQARGHGVDVVAQVDLDPPRIGVDRHLRPHRDAVGERAHRVVRPLGLEGHPRQLLDRRRHPPLRVEPLGDELAHGVDPVLVDDLLQPSLADPRRAEHRQVVAVPLVRHADPPPAHADPVADVLVVALHLRGAEDQRALLVVVAREGVVARRDRVADVGLVGLGGGGEEVLALAEDRHHDRVVARVRIRLIGIVVEVGVALAHLRVGASDRRRLQVGAEDVDRHPLRRRQQLVVGGGDRAGEVARDRDHRRVAGPQQRPGHVADDRVEAVGEDGEQGGVEDAVAGGVGPGRGRRPVAAWLGHAHRPYSRPVSTR